MISFFRYLGHKKICCEIPRIIMIITLFLLGSPFFKIKYHFERTNLTLKRLDTFTFQGACLNLQKGESYLWRKRVNLIKANEYRDSNIKNLNLLEKRGPYRDAFLYEKTIKTDIYEVCYALITNFSFKKWNF